MAEARLAVALQFQVTDEGIILHFDSNAFKFVFRAITKTIKRRMKEAKVAILKRSFPATPASWLVLVAALSAARYTEHETTLGVLENLERRIPGAHNLSPSTVIALAVMFVATVLWLLMGHILQFTLRQLLKYRRFLYEPRGKISFTTRCWWGLVKLLGGRSPLLYSYQNSIPYMPVPDLNSTVKKYLESVQPVMDESQFSKMKKLAEEFKSSIAGRLQRYLVLKSWWSTNWVTDWWEQYVYLSSRSPLLMNSNYYGMDSINHPTKRQSSRAGNIIFALLYYRKQIMKERLEPQFALGIVPLCSEQFRRTFNTTRIPGKTQDKLEHHRNSSHVAVYHRGRFYKLDIYYRGTLLQPADFECQIQKILEDKAEPLPGEELMPALTTADRTLWAETREKYFDKGVNQKSLHMIERAAFFLCLDDDEMDYAAETSDNCDRFAKATLAGNGHNIWFDKSFCVTVYKNGRIGYTAEHSWADAPIMSHLGEWIATDDAKYLGYQDDGHCKGEMQFESLPHPAKLEWNIPPQCVEVLESCQSKAEEMIRDVDVHIYINNKFGKGIMKKCKVSPDAFIQIALQLAYYRDQGRVDLTYESSMTRLFREGRTETVRPCTMESTRFVHAMADPDVTSEERRALFRKAVDRHVFGFRQCMEGKGIDRHLFCLYVVTRYLEVDSPFLKEALSSPWKLSTSQTSIQQTKKLDLIKNPEMVTAGGGFGPVADDGYGVSYIIGGEDLLFFHVTCKNSAAKTDSKRFGQLIDRSLMDIINMFEEEKPKQI